MPKFLDEEYQENKRREQEIEDARNEGIEEGRRQVLVEIADKSHRCNICGGTVSFDGTAPTLQDKVLRDTSLRPSINTNVETCVGYQAKPIPTSGYKCCDRAGDYNGYQSGKTIFTCPKGCGCHD